MRLDQTCVHQSNIRDSMRVLHANVMACKQMLVISGATYPNRLLCIHWLMRMATLIWSFDVKTVLLACLILMTFCKITATTIAPNPITTTTASHTYHHQVDH